MVTRQQTSFLYEALLPMSQTNASWSFVEPGIGDFSPAPTWDLDVLWINSVITFVVGMTCTLCVFWRKQVRHEHDLLVVFLFSFALSLLVFGLNLAIYTALGLDYSLMPTWVSELRGLLQLPAALSTPWFGFVIFVGAMGSRVLLAFLRDQRLRVFYRYTLASLMACGYTAVVVWVCDLVPWLAPIVIPIVTFWWDDAFYQWVAWSTLLADHWVNLPEAYGLKEISDWSRLDAARYWVTLTINPAVRVMKPGFFMTGCFSVFASLLAIPFWIPFMAGVGILARDMKLADIYEMWYRFQEGKAFFKAIHKKDYKQASRTFIDNWQTASCDDTDVSLGVKLPQLIVAEVTSLAAFVYLMFTNGGKGRIAAFWLYFTDVRMQFVRTALQMALSGIVDAMPEGRDVGKGLDEFYDRLREESKTRRARLKEIKIQSILAKKLQLGPCDFNLKLKILEKAHDLQLRIDHAVECATNLKTVGELKKIKKDVDAFLAKFGTDAETQAVVLKQALRDLRKRTNTEITNLNLVERVKLRIAELKKAIGTTLSMSPDIAVELSMLEFDLPIIEDGKLDAHGFWDFMPEVKVFEMLSAIATQIGRGFGVSYGKPRAEETERLKELVNSAKAISAVSVTGTFFIKITKFLLNFTYIRVYGHAFDADPDVVESITCWNAVIAEKVVPALRTGQGRDSVGIEVLQQLYDQGLKILALLERKKLKLVDFPFFSHNFELVKAYKLTVGERAIARPVPASLLIAGKASAGKTSLGIKLARSLAVHFGLADAPDADILYTVVDNAADEKKFRDNYHGQLVFLHNDLGNIKDQDVQVATISDVMTMIDHCPVKLNAAAAEKKDAIQFNSRFWVGTTNANPDTMCYNEKIDREAYEAFKTRIGFYLMPLELKECKSMEQPRYKLFSGQAWFDYWNEGTYYQKDVTDVTIDDLINHSLAPNVRKVRVDSSPEERYWKLYSFESKDPFGVVSYEAMVQFLLLASVENHQRMLRHAHRKVEKVHMQLPEDMMAVNLFSEGEDFQVPVNKRNNDVHLYFIAAFALLAIAGTGYGLWQWMHSGKKEEEATSGRAEYPEKVREPPVKQDMSSVKPVVSEATMLGSISDGARLVANNVVKLRFTIQFGPHTTSDTGLALGLYDRTCVTASHVVEDLVRAQKENCTTILYIGEYAVAMKDLVIRHDVAHHKSLIIVKDQRMPQFKDIRSRLIRQHELPTSEFVSSVQVSNPVAYTPQHGKVDSSFALNWVRYERFEKISIVESNSFGRQVRHYRTKNIGHSSPTKKGDSGGPVLFHPIKDGTLPIVAGLTVSGCADQYNPTSFCVILSLDWLDSILAYEATSAKMPLTSDFYSPKVDGHQIGVLRGNVPVVGGKYYKAGPFLGSIPCGRIPRRMHGEPQPSVLAMEKVFRPEFHCSEQTVRQLRRVVDWMMRQIAPPVRKHALSIVEAINGASDILYSNAIHRDTGAGARFKLMTPDGDPNRIKVNGNTYPMTGKNAWLIGQGNHFEPSPLLTSAIHQVPQDTRMLLFSLKHNETGPLVTIAPGLEHLDGVIMPPFNPQLLADCEAKAARPLMGDDQAFAIFDRMYLTIFCDARYRGHLTTSSSGGLNPLNGSHWQTIYQRLNLGEDVIEDYRDVKTFGFSQPPELLDACWDGIINWHIMHGFDQQYVDAVKVCKDKYFSAVFVKGDVVYKNPMPGIDGVLLTFELNSLTNEASSRQVYWESNIEVYGDTEEVFDLSMRTYKCVKGGDDSADTWTAKHHTLHSAAARLKKNYNFDVTSATKGPIPLKYEVEDRTFLKRRITPEGLAMLDKTSIWNAGNFWKKSRPEVPNEVQLCATEMLFEMHMWGEEAYNELLKQMWPVLVRFGVQTQVPTFARCVAYWKMERSSMTPVDFMDAGVAYNFQTHALAALAANESSCLPASYHEACSLKVTEDVAQTDGHLTTFTDEGKPEIIEVVPVNPTLPAIFSDNEKSTVVERVFRHTVNWAYTDLKDNVIATRIYPLDLGLIQPIVDRLSFVRRVRFGVKVSIRITPSQANYGALMLAWCPAQRTSAATSWRSLHSAPQGLRSFVYSGYNHYILEPNDPNPTEFVIPYIGVHNYMAKDRIFDVNQPDAYMVGMWKLIVLQPLYSVTNSNAQRVEIVVSESIVGLEMLGAFDATSGKETFSKTGEFVKTVKAVAHMSNTLAIAAALPDPAKTGPDDLVQPQIDLMVPNTEGPKSTAVMAPTRRAITSDDFALMHTKDEMGYAGFIQTPMIIEEDEFPSPGLAGDHILTFPVHPLHNDEVTIAGSIYTPTSYMSGGSMFRRLWSGPIKYAIYFFTHKLMRVRVSIGWATAPLTVSSPRGNFIGEVFEISGACVKTFSIPWAQYENFSDIHTGIPNGYITMRLETAVMPFDSGITPHVHFVIYAAAGEDMAYAGSIVPPYTFEYLQGKETNPRELFKQPFQPLGGMRSCPVPNTGSSWEIDSMRTLMSWPAPHEVSTGYTNGWTHMSVLTPFNFYTKFYLVWRGGVRFEGFTAASTRTVFRIVAPGGNAVHWMHAVFWQTINPKISVLLPWTCRHYMLYTQTGMGLCTRTAQDEQLIADAAIVGSFVGGDDFICGWMVPGPMRKRAENGKMEEANPKLEIDEAVLVRVVPGVLPVEPPVYKRT